MCVEKCYFWTTKTKQTTDVGKSYFKHKVFFWLQLQLNHGRFDRFFKVFVSFSWYIQRWEQVTCDKILVFLGSPQQASEQYRNIIFTDQPTNHSQICFISIHHKNVPINPMKTGTSSVTIFGRLKSRSARIRTSSSGR